MQGIKRTRFLNSNTDSMTCRFLANVFNLYVTFNCKIKNYGCGHSSPYEHRTVWKSPSTPSGQFGFASCTH